MDRPVIVVTAAGGGIGSAVARLLAPDHALVLVDVDAGALEATVTSLASSTMASAVVADCATEVGAAGSVDHALDSYGTLDGLVNVAGGGRAGRKVPDVTLADWEAVLALSLTSTFLMCRAAMAHLERTHGAIVNVSSVAGIRGMHESPAYCAAKGGIIGLTAALTLDHGPAGVRVNCVAPGAVATPLLRAHRSAEQIDALGAGALVGRVAEPEEIAGVVRFLLSDGASYLLGQTLTVDGGLPTLA